MVSRGLSLIFFVLSISAVSSRTGLAQEKIPGIGPVGMVQRLHTGFAFTEGPAVDAEGTVYFTDIPNNRIHKLDTKGQLSVFAEPSGHCNGLMVVGDRLLACEMDGRLKQYSLKDAAETVLADKYQDKRFNAPNDLVIDRTGGIYFTDPRFRARIHGLRGKRLCITAQLMAR